MVAVAGGPVKPHVQAFADEINRRFGFTHIITYPTHSPTLDRALDCFGPGATAAAKQKKMLELAWWCTRDDVINWFGIDYAIFNANPTTIGGEIWNRELARAWRQMPNRGTPTQNHHDHVHVSFEKVGTAAPFGGAPSPIPIITTGTWSVEEEVMKLCQPSTPPNSGVWLVGEFKQWIDEAADFGHFANLGMVDFTVDAQGKRHAVIHGVPESWLRDRPNAPGSKVPEGWAEKIAGP